MRITDVSESSPLAGDQAPAACCLEELDLAAGEWLSDRPPVLWGRCVVIEGETSIGKTTYVLDHLAQQDPVLLLLPTVNQVQQIALTRAGCALSVVHGRSQPERLERTIVATYDQLRAITAALGTACANYLLVVDEIHKLYQAGSYRAKALQGIFDAIDTLGQPSGFRQVIGLSATLQPDLLDFAVTQWIVVRKPNPVVRQVVIVEYKDLELWVETLLKQGWLPPDCLNVIRLNNAQRLHELAAFFTQHGYRCLVVHSKIQDEEVIQEMLAAEWVADDCQILLTTSLLDEGINLHNDNLGIVHLIGDVHSGELRQFLGRFRQSNPELLLHIAGLPEVAPVDLVQERDSMLAFQHKTVEACQALVAHPPAPRLSSSASSVMALVKGLNASYQRFCQFDPLIARIQPTGAVEVRPNRPGLLAYLYQLDALNHYVSLTTLVERLEQQLVHCEIHHYRVNARAPDQVVEQDLCTAAQVVEKERLALIKKTEKRLARAVTTGCFADPLDALESLVATVARDNTLESSMWRLLWELASQVAVDDQTALAMLRANHQRQVWRFVKGLDDVLIRAFHQALVACRAEYAPGSDDPLEIPRSYAQTVVLDTLAQVAQRDPHYQVSAQLTGSKKRGVHCDATGCFEVTPRAGPPTNLP